MKVQGRNAEGSSAWASPSAASLFRSYRSIWSSPPKEGESGGAQEVADDEDTQTEEPLDQVSCWIREQYVGMGGALSWKLAALGQRNSSPL